MGEGAKSKKGVADSRFPWFDLDGEYVELKQSLRLISGAEVPRDTSQARSILAGLSRSRNREIAQDARSVLKNGSENGWFDDNIPTRAQLERVARDSTEYYRTWKKRARIAQLILGLLAVTLLGLIYLLITGTIPTFLT